MPLHHATKQILGMQAAMVDQRVKSKKKSKAKEEEAAIQAAISAAKAAAAAGVTVRIHSVNETAGRQTLECPQMDLAGQRPLGLHGGALLGVAVTKHLKSGVTLMASPFLFSSRVLLPWPSPALTFLMTLPLALICWSPQWVDTMLRWAMLGWISCA